MTYEIHRQFVTPYGKLALEIVCKNCGKFAEMLACEVAPDCPCETPAPAKCWRCGRTAVEEGVGLRRIEGDKHECIRIEICADVTACRLAASRAENKAMREERARADAVIEAAKYWRRSFGRETYDGAITKLSIAINEYNAAAIDAYAATAAEKEKA